MYRNVTTLAFGTRAWPLTAVGRRGLVLAIMASSSVGCIGAGDIFAPKFSLPGGYALFRAEGPYMIVSDGVASGTRKSPLLGWVEFLGWNDRHLVVNGRSGRNSEGWRWVILDVPTGETKGPLTDAEFKDLVDRDVALRQVKILPAEAAWKELSQRRRRAFARAVLQGLGAIIVSVALLLVSIWLLWRSRSRRPD